MRLLDLLDVAAVVGAVGDSVTGYVHGSGHPAHPQPTVGDHGELNTERRWERDCREKKMTNKWSVQCNNLFYAVFLFDAGC